MGQLISKRAKAKTKTKPKPKPEANASSTAPTSPSPPPPYNNQVPENQQNTPKKPPQPRKIQASDTPKWRWTNAECQEWLTEVLVHYCGRERAQASSQAKAFMGDGFGPELFSLNLNVWRSALGNKAGHNIYSLIYSLRHQEGALPSGLTFPHYKSADLGREGRRAESVVRSAG